MIRLTFAIGLLLLFSGPLVAQESSSFRLEQGHLNVGGSPADGVSPASAGYRISLDAIGEGIGSRALSAPSFRLDSNFVPAYGPPSEVEGLRFVSASTLAWDAAPSAVEYAIYRGGLSTVPGTAYGNCLDGEVAATTFADPEIPTLTTGYFYLVTSSNRLDEEGAKGYDSAGAERPNPAPCP